MKPLPSALLLVGLLFQALAPASAEPSDDRPPRTAVELELLVAPIALYPDPLVALILPASTRPSEIVLAARFLSRGKTPEEAVRESWDDSVKPLTRYPEIITYLDENLEWTSDLGEAFIDEPEAVMAAVQTVRNRAYTSGLLSSSAQQEVIHESAIIRIVPANPTVIYIPRYDYDLLYTSSRLYFAGPFLTFGVGYAVGTWLNYDCDWRYRSLRVIHRPHDWYQRPDWRGYHPPLTPHGFTRWHPSPHRDRTLSSRPHTGIHRPAPPVSGPERLRPSSPHAGIHERFDPDRDRSSPNHRRPPSTARNPQDRRDDVPRPDRPHSRENWRARRPSTAGVQPQTDPLVPNLPPPTPTIATPDLQTIPGVPAPAPRPRLPRESLDSSGPRLRTPSSDAPVIRGRRENSPTDTPRPTHRARPDSVSERQLSPSPTPRATPPLPSPTPRFDRPESSPPPTRREPDPERQRDRPLDAPDRRVLH